MRPRGSIYQAILLIALIASLASVSAISSVVRATTLPHATAETTTFPSLHHNPLKHQDQQQADSLTYTPIIQVLNDLTQEPVVGAQISSYSHPTTHAASTFTDAQGTARLTLKLNAQSPTANLLINKPGFISLIPTLQSTDLQTEGDTLRLYLQPATHAIPPIIVTGKSQRYHRKGTQGYQLAMAVARQEEKRRTQDTEGHTHKRMDQITISWANFNFNYPWIQKLIPFLPEYLIQSKLTQRPTLPLSQRYEVRRIGTDPKQDRENEEILYRKVTGVDQNIDDGTLTQALHEIFPPIDLFQSYIHLLDNEFPSPLSRTGHLHYRYYLTDTIVTLGRVAQQIDFYPISPIVPSFRGTLYITMGEQPQLIQSLLTTNKVTNVGFLEELRIKQSYAPEPHPTDSLHTIWKVQKEEMAADVRLFLKALTLNIDHQRFYFDRDQEEDQAILQNTNPLIDLSDQPEAKRYALILRNRHLLTNTAELEHFMEKLRENRLTGTLLALVDMISVDYIRMKNNPYLLYGGSLLELGPISQIIRIGGEEKLRAQLGARTTAYLHPHHFIKGYLAYTSNLKDLTYDLYYLYSFLPKRYYAEEFPRHDIALQYQYEKYYPGEHHWSELDKDHATDLGETHLTRQSLRHLWKATYTRDIHNEFSLQLYYQHTTDYPIYQSNYIRVLKDKTILSYPFIKDSLLGISLRWSPGEKIIEGSMQRQNWYQKRRHELPVFYLKHHFATPFLGGAYLRNRTEITADQKVWLGSFGRFDYQVNLGKIWESVPLPFLYSPPLNRDWELRRHTFKLLGVDEVVADQWLALFTEWHFRGVVSNRIPLLSELKLRGVLSFNLLWGETTRKNQQKHADELFILPHLTTEMSYDKPYMEIGYGIESILNILRIDFFYRLTKPLPEGARPWSIKLSLHTSF